MPNREIDILACEIDVLVVADTRRSMSGWASANRPSRFTSHLAAKSGEVLTVKTPDFAAATAFRADRDPIQRIADHGKIFAASFGNYQSLAFAIE